MRTTQKELKNLVKAGTAIDVTNAGPEIINDIIYGRTVLAYSCGTYGVNGVLVKAWNDQLYAVIGRTTNLLLLIY